MNTREGREKVWGRGRSGKKEERFKEGDGEEEEQEVGERRRKSREQRLGSSTGRANYKTQLKWYHENALSNIVSTVSRV